MSVQALFFGVVVDKLGKRSKIADAGFPYLN